MMAASASLKRLFGVMEYLVDDHVGVIREVKEVPAESGSPNFFHFYAQACNTRAFCGQTNFGTAGGASADRGLAAAKAIGEAVERYCSALYETDTLPLVSFDAAPFPCVFPEEFALYTKEQYAGTNFPYVPFERCTPVRWTPAFDVITGEPCYVPAAMVFMPYHYNGGRAEPPIVQPISTGLACHSSLAEASIAAICEVIERDAFTITWQSAWDRPHILNDTLSDRNRDLVERFERVAGCAVTLLNLTMEHGVPTILSVLRSAVPAAPALVFAASSDPDPEKAARKSLEELAHTRRLAQRLKAERPSFRPSPGCGNVSTQEAHVNVYCDHANAHLADFIFSSDRRIHFREIESLSTGDPGNDLESLADRIRDANHRILLADLTTPDVRELGLCVVRAVIPGFHPLFIGHQARVLGGMRLRQVPRKLGHTGIAPASGDNPAPHPYP